MSQRRKTLNETKKLVTKPKKKVIEKPVESDSSSSEENVRPQNPKGKRAANTYKYYYGIRGQAACWNNGIPVSGTSATTMNVGHFYGPHAARSAVLLYYSCHNSTLYFVILICGGVGFTTRPLFKACYGIAP